MSFGDVAESVAIELLRQAVRLGGDAVHSMLDRGAAFNDSDLASRVRGMLLEESESRRAALRL
jgi:hypothetical protein